MKFSLVVSFLFTFFFVGSCISAQEDTPAWTVEEIGLRLVNLQDFSFMVLHPFVWV